MRIAAISDLHGTFPVIPECDVLIIAGDICPDKFGPYWARLEPTLQKAWFDDVFLPWLAEQDQAKVKLLTWGNHDYCGHIYGRDRIPLGLNTHLITDAPITIDGVKFWLTPWSNQFMDWAWMKPHADLAPIYAKIPDDVDVLVSHQPPYGYGDIYPNLLSGKMEHIASSELLYAIERVKPKVVVCGHLHGGYGMYQEHGTTIYNVSVVDEQYKLVNPATIFEVDA